MNLDSDELDQLSKNVYGERYIGHDMLCEHCGYNLRTLRYAGRCPECGRPYFARPGREEGACYPTDVFFPWLELVGVVFFVAWAVLLIMRSLKPVRSGVLVLAVGLLMIAFMIGARFRRRWAFYRVFRHHSADFDAND